MIAIQRKRPQQNNTPVLYSTQSLKLTKIITSLGIPPSSSSLMQCLWCAMKEERDMPLKNSLTDIFPHGSSGCSCLKKASKMILYHLFCQCLCASCRCLGSGSPIYLPPGPSQWWCLPFGTSFPIRPTLWSIFLHSAGHVRPFYSIRPLV